MIYDIRNDKQNTFKIPISKFLTAIGTLVFFLIYCACYELKFINEDIAIFLLSVLGWISLVFSIFTWKKITGMYFTLYTIFIIFAYLFNYGQCLMWALGIHFKGEIGTTWLYTLPIPSKNGIIKTQMISLMGLVAFHCGALLMARKTRKDKIARIDSGKILKNLESRVLWEICRVTLIISMLCMYYALIRDVVINRIYGYGATLYNQDVVASQNNIVLLVRMMFFPSIIGILIGRGYNKTDRIVCYLAFAVFVILNIMGGHRGTWIYPLIILIWMDHTFIKRINVKKGFLYLISGIFIVLLTVAVRNTRGTSISLSSIMYSVINEENPIVSAVFEMGGSMRPALIITEHGWGKYPYGNTYILAVFGMVTERVIKIFIPNYIGVSSWFSQVYLGIKYGAGFSMIAEALINYGPYSSIPFLFLLGVIYSRLITTNDVDVNEHPLTMFVKISALYVMIYSVRNYILGSLKLFVFSTLFIYIAVLFVRNYKKARLRHSFIFEKKG